MALVVGTGSNSPLTPVLRARVARELLAAHRGTRGLALSDDAAARSVIGAIFNAARIPCPWEPTGALPALERLIVKSIPGKTRRALPGACQEIAAHAQSPEEFRIRAIASLDRVAAVVCRKSGGGARPRRREHLGAEFVARTHELLRFVVSPIFSDARVALGLEGGAA